MNMDLKEKVFICGGGHQGLSMAAHLALNDVQVTMWNRSANNIQEIIDTKEIHCSGIVNGVAVIEKASTNIEEVFADVVMVTTPSSAHKDIAKQLAPFVNKDTVIILNPGRTFGAIEFAETLLKNGVEELPHIAETQTIVYTCRRSDKNSCTIFALKSGVQIGAIKGSNLDYIMGKIPNCLRKYFIPVASVAMTSLSNVGMVLHCAPVLMNTGWIETEKVDFKYYYDGISQTVANLLEKIDLERVTVAEAKGYKIETLVEWLRRTYDASGNDIYSCIRTTDAYREIDAPQNLNTRYLYEDIPNGLVPVECLGKSIGIPTPAISTVIELASLTLDIDFRKQGRWFSKEIFEKYI